MTKKSKLAKIGALLSLGCFALSLISPLVAQTTPEYVKEHIECTAGNYLPYSYQESERTKVPKGYKPFYISHYGRHGSRFHYSGTDYEKMYHLFRKADSAKALTSKGVEVMNRFKLMDEAFHDRAGDLTKKGVEQHKGIAERMVDGFPEIFKKGSFIDVKSSTSTRCIMSMDAFCQQLRIMEPKLNIQNESSKRWMYYLAAPNDAGEDIAERQKDPAWSVPFGELHARYVHPSRMVAQLFSDADYVKDNIDTIAFMREFYVLNSSLLSENGGISFEDVWTKEELYDNWVVQNAWWYGAYGPCPLTKNESRFFAKNLLGKMIEEADEAIAKGDVQAHLRFGHDTGLLPLTSLMGLSGCNTQTTNLDSLVYHWNEFKIIPMGGNIQLVFYRSKKETEVLLKVLLNEREVTLPIESKTAPYYKWSEVKRYYKELMR